MRLALGIGFGARIAPAPIVTSINISTADTLGGDAFTLTGSGFTGATTVKFGLALATSLVVVSNVSITGVTPAHAAGAVPISVNVPAVGTGVLSGAVTYVAVAAPTVSAITPNSGSDAGGDAITNLAGTGFRAGATVSIGGATATSVVVVSSTKITCVTPAHGSDVVVDVVVTNTDGQTSGASGAGLFTYVASFDIPSLNLGLYFKAGDFLIYPGGGSGSAGSAVWVGTASAGVSGGFDAYHDNASSTYAGPTLDGLVTVNFTSTNTQGKTLRISTADAGARAGTPGASETAVANCLTAGMYASSTGFSWVLVNIASITPGSGEAAIVQGPGNSHGGPSILTSGQGPWPSGASGTFIDVGNDGSQFYGVPAPGTLGVWVAIYFRWNAGVWEVAFNSDAWSSPSSGNPDMAVGERLALGSFSYGAAPVTLANMGMSPVNFDDATRLNIHGGLQALYPSAGLP